jgi:hypothetical protein
MRWLNLGAPRHCRQGMCGIGGETPLPDPLPARSSRRRSELWRGERDGNFKVQQSTSEKLQVTKFRGQYSLQIIRRYSFKRPPLPIPRLQMRRGRRAAPSLGVVLPDPHGLFLAGEEARAFPGSQATSIRRPVQAYSTLPVRSNVLRARDGSRSGAARRYVPILTGGRPHWREKDFRV